VLHVVDGEGGGRAVGVLLHVGVEVREVLVVAGRAVEEDATVDGDEFYIEADLDELVLDHGLNALTNLGGGGDVLERELCAILLANIAIEHPTSFVEKLPGHV